MLQIFILFQMTRMLLPKMVKKGGGVIVNISSSASFWPIKNLVTYSATKVTNQYSIHPLFSFSFLSSSSSFFFTGTVDFVCITD